MKHSVHLLGNRHLNVIPGRESESCRRAADAFRDLAMQSGKNLRQLAPPAQLGPNGTVTGQRAGTGQDEVSNAGKPGKSLAASAAGNGEACDLSNPAGNESSR